MAQVLRHLPQSTDPNVLVGTNTVDDAAVYRLTDEIALIQTVDYFTPVVDDPYAFGAIAVANGLSDVYAMGGRPITALNIVGFPVGTLPLSVLTTILQGGSDKAAEAGVSVVGGHTITDPEPKYGIAVTGLSHPGKVITNAGARPGDVLILTKPLGIGIITTAIKLDLVSQATIDRIVKVMSALNKSASESMVAAGVKAATDVTGFGLLGHLWEMLRAGKVGARIHAGSVPVLEEAWDLARAGVVPGGTYANRSFLGDSVTWGEGLGEDVQLILCDAQTSGGLLISVPAGQASDLERDLRRRGVSPVARIGEIVAEPVDRIIVDT